MKEFENFKKRNAITKTAEDTKFAVVGVLILSIMIFTIIGEQNTKAVIWYWAAIMTLLPVICIIQDITNKLKIKKLGL